MLLECRSSRGRSAANRRKAERDYDVHVMFRRYGELLAIPPFAA